MTSVEYTPESTPFDDLDELSAQQTPSLQVALIDRLGVEIRALTTALEHFSALVKEQRESTAQGGVSSVQIEQGAKEVRVVVKAYAESPIQPAGDAALAEFERQINLIRDGQLRDWQRTVDQLAERTTAA